MLLSSPSHTKCFGCLPNCLFACPAWILALRCGFATCLVSSLFLMSLINHSRPRLLSPGSLPVPACLPNLRSSLSVLLPAHGSSVSTQTVSTRCGLTVLPSRITKWPQWVIMQSEYVPVPEWSVTLTLTQQYSLAPSVVWRLKCFSQSHPTLRF